LRELKAIEYTCGLSVVIVGLGLYFYYVRELLASLLLFSVAFFFLDLVALGAFLIWYESWQLAIWTGPVSRHMVAISLRFITAYARP
jgi:hypothetical protein